MPLKRAWVAANGRYWRSVFKGDFREYLTRGAGGRGFCFESDRWKCVIPYSRTFGPDCSLGVTHFQRAPGKTGRLISDLLVVFARNHLMRLELRRVMDKMSAQLVRYRPIADIYCRPE